MVTIKKKIKLLKNQIYLYLLMILRIKFFILIQLFIHQFYLKMIKNKNFMMKISLSAKTIMHG